MSPRDIDEAITDRFRRWGRFLREQGATPMIVLGLRAADNTIVITTVEEFPDELLVDALVGAARMIAEGEAEAR